MRFSPRRVAAVTFGVVPVLLVAGCGSSDGDDARATITPIQGSSYVTIAQATTTTTTSTVPGATLPEGAISPTEQTYQVVAGDSLSKIAGLYDLESIDVLCNYNGWTDCPDHLLLPGDQILIPPNAPVPSAGGEAAAGGETTDDGTTDETATGEDGECPTTYVIAAGDTSRIRVADRFGITYQEMDAANANTPGYANFVVGTAITIPCPS